MEFSNLKTVNQTCSNCNGSVFLERTCLNKDNCTGQNNIRIAFNEKEIIKRKCSITENQSNGGFIPGKQVFLHAVM